ncbi:adenosylmethionine--8-amino-7-oxononanoate transaminase [Gordonia pseudamarae]|uniref:Adenosylmethionine-8-amino-7-oxononanoate aminotransferase n=1 Tax=Gordonia pseudamarae TaxID=2831662 RepID=A0ABX6IIE8_9ACTN|nr:MULTISPECIES: adenosylmethionine--8-amino-7-oxononanoate transaminase [Gordonia]MBD0023000.1 adenosylmethionine--8-amino-7-oxononanoate transaminase [Gordonia sp. (in: high G+C Gram-positive bacteria)]QHN26769.1 adenosylmethionine--8-amino-7-oxononanoate transaminase [Gordonia pseudamarae]QHN35662.1 adenosylmethionine--8-amino-7-oxononanoate transaminase [Gordonia pseudamarae]
MDEATISRIDAEHIWHPYGAVPAASVPLVVDHAEGVRLHLADGRTVIDGMSSWWAAIHGYRHPVLDAAVTAQLDSMSHVMFGGLTHRPAAELARRLVEHTPAGLDRVFFCDSGSVSVEVAAKMAIQYWRSRGRGERTKLLTWRGGYHGDTLTPMSVCDPDGGMHAMWRSVLPAQVFVPEPPALGGTDADADAYVALLDEEIGSHAAELAAVIIEPVVQGAGGMRFHDPRLLRALREICDHHDVLLIFDEIATGFGRTGELFAADHAGVAPDVMCVGKALTGGYLTLAATLCSARIAETISAGEAGGLAHGPTFMANPLACAVAVASIDLLLDSPWRHRVAQISAGLTAGLDPLRGVPGVRDVRVLGAIGVVQLDAPVDMTAATGAAVDAGVWLRPFRDLIYTMPPFLCTDGDIAAICAGVTSAATARHLVSPSPGENR